MLLWAKERNEQGSSHDSSYCIVQENPRSYRGCSQPCTSKHGWWILRVDQVSMVVSAAIRNLHAAYA